MPEGDALHRAARRLQVLVGERIEAESRHPRAVATRVAEQIDGRVLVAVEAVGKNLLLRFEDGIVVRSHLRMTGRWHVGSSDERIAGRPWLVLRAGGRQAVLWNGPVLALERPGTSGRIGPDILAQPLDVDTMVARVRANPDRELGDVLLDQRLVAGIGNVWKAEALWAERLSPWTKVGDVAAGDVRRLLLTASTLMRAALDGGRASRRVYRRAGRPCPRCGARIRSRVQGDAARTTYWCPRCQGGPEASST